ncbi:MAG: hypothetical protein KKA90_00850 [Nanoarchaeota archaeon]|nr:hypothetical protein [Nanoarchaeota archaeon]
MDIDWPISFITFLVFIIWGLVFYASLFEPPSEDLRTAMEGVANTVIENISIEVTDLPVAATTTLEEIKILRLSYFFPSQNARNSTKILVGGTSVPCQFFGDTVQWNDYLYYGTTHYTLRFADKSVPQHCNAQVLIFGNTTQVDVGAAETKTMFSIAQINTMTNMSLGAFRTEHNINRNFKVEFNLSGTITAFGPEPPPLSNVYVTERRGALEEDESELHFRIFVW